jgi:ubiquinone/menaquinone biosynthesis C-methylase UbiE
LETQDYKYNATDDSLLEFVKLFTSRVGDGTGDIEEVYLSSLKLIASCKPGAKYLDIGSGLGRIIEIMRHSAGTLVGLEPDVARFQGCHKAHHDGERVRIINSTTSAFREADPDARFDVIILSMVLQHVSTGTCAQILRDVHELLTPEGVAIISSTHFYEERFLYLHEQTPRSSEEYDRYAVDIANQQWGIPVRMFSKASFHSAIERAGLQTMVWGQFSYVRPEKLSDLADLYLVPPEALRDVGISQYAVVKRRPRAKSERAKPGADLLAAIRRIFAKFRGGTARPVSTTSSPARATASAAGASPG